MTEIAPPGPTTSAWIAWQQPRWLTAAALAALAGLYAVLAYIQPLHLDSGVFLYTGQVIADGGAPYRDSWDHKGPLLYLLNLAGLAIAPGLTGIYLLEGAGIVGSLGLALWLWRRHAAPQVLALAALAYAGSYAVLFAMGNYTETWQVPWSLPAYALWARWLLDRHKTGGGTGLFAVALLLGLAGGAAAMMRPSNGVGLFVAAIVLVALAGDRRWRAASWVLVGGLAVCLPLMALVAWWGVAGEMVSQYVIYNFVYLGGADSGDFDRALPIMAFYFAQAPLVGLLGLAVLAGCARPRAMPWSALGFVLLAVLADLAAALSAGRPYLHYLAIMPPVLLVAVLVAARGLPAVPGGALSILAALLALFLVRELWVGTAAAWRVGLANPQSGTSKTVEAIKRATAPGEGVVIYGLGTGYLALAERRSPTTITYILPLILREAQPGDMIDAHFAAIRADPPAMVLRTRTFCPLDRIECPVDDRYSAPEDERLGALRAWIRAHYRPGEQVAGHRIWVRTGGDSAHLR